LSQAFNSSATEPSSADHQEEPILVETANASKMAEDVSPPILSLMLTKYFLKNS